MDYFESVYETKGFWPDYLKCNYCGERVERGILSVIEHLNNCKVNPHTIIDFNQIFTK